MSQMTQQYKGMQVQMMKTLQEKDNKIAELTASLEEKDKELEDTKNEKDKAIAMKEAEIAELKEKVRMGGLCVHVVIADPGGDSWELEVSSLSIYLTLSLYLSISISLRVFLSLYIYPTFPLSQSPDHAQMDEMADEFGKMLQETLEKMNKKIEVGGGDWEEQDSVPMKNKLQEFK